MAVNLVERVLRVEHEGHDVYGLSVAPPLEEFYEEQRLSAYQALAEYLLFRATLDDETVPVWGDYIIEFRDGQQAGFSVCAPIHAFDLHETFQPEC